MELTQKTLLLNSWTATLDKTQKGWVEKQAYEKGLLIAGVDEVGRGCLAGPVYTASAILDLRKLFMLPPKERNLIRDSKKLSLKQKKEAADILKEVTLSSSIGISSVETIERLGIVPATFAAMRSALSKLKHPFSKVYVDGNKTIPSYTATEQEFLIKGDNLSFTIAAASILAKLSRDAYMTEQAEAYPDYGFERHVGYGTKAHLEAIHQHGVTPLHRKTFAPIRDYC